MVLWKTYMPHVYEIADEVILTTMLLVIATPIPCEYVVASSYIYIYSFIYNDIH